MDNEIKTVCPGCGRHCDLSAPSCERGETYARTGELPERKGHDEHGHEHGHGPEGHHGPHGPKGPYDPEDPHGPHGPRGPKGPHGGPKPHRSVLDSERYNDLDEDGKLLALLRELGHLVRFGFDGKGSQGRVLRILAENGVMTQRELTERLGIQPGSASEVIGKLEAAGLVARTQSDSDRRTADIRLTEAGTAKAAEAAQRKEDRTSEMFGALSAQEQATLLSLLEKLAGSLKGHVKDYAQN